MRLPSYNLFVCPFRLVAYFIHKLHDSKIVSKFVDLVNKHDKQRINKIFERSMRVVSSNVEGKDNWFVFSRRR